MYINKFKYFKKEYYNLIMTNIKKLLLLSIILYCKASLKYFHIN